MSKSAESPEKSRKRHLEEGKRSDKSPEVPPDDPHVLDCVNSKDYLGVHTVEREKAREELEKAKEEKRDVPLVHSANKWEEANLGDDGRKAKFLKLMGGAKTTHTGRFVCGEKGSSVADTVPSVVNAHEEQSTSADEEKSETYDRKALPDLEDKLEAQYKESMANTLKLRDKRHRGLGYHGQTETDLRADEDKPPQKEPTPPPPHVHDANVDHRVDFVHGHNEEPDSNGEHAEQQTGKGGQPKKQ